MRILLIISAILILSYPSKGQSNIDALGLIKEQNFAKHQYDKRKVTYLFKENKSVLVKYNPFSLAFGGLLFIYQKGISPQISVDCPYELSCSNFSKRCIQHYGIFKGLALTADRLTRCTQFTLIDLKPIQFNNKNKPSQNHLRRKLNSLIYLFLKEILFLLVE